MIRYLALVLAVLLAAAPLRAQEGAAEEAIRGVIARQLEAFNDRDVTTAFGFASPGIRRLFGTEERFGLMVEQGYPMVWTNRGTEFLELREVQGRLFQRVRITDADGRAHVLDYAMIETADGWKIDGVQILPAPDVGV